VLFVLEAEYAHEWEKPLLPVRVQPKYKPNGWLGFLLGTKYRYCLTEADRYDSEVSLLLLKVQELITGVQQPSLDVIGTSSNNLVTSVKVTHFYLFCILLAYNGIVAVSANVSQLSKLSVSLNSNALREMKIYSVRNQCTLI